MAVRTREDWERELAKAQARVAELEGALEKAAAALDLTADFLADDETMGRLTATIEGVRDDAEQARKALASDGSRVRDVVEWQPLDTAPREQGKPLLFRMVFERQGYWDNELAGFILDRPLATDYARNGQWKHVAALGEADDGDV